MPKWNVSPGSADACPHPASADACALPTRRPRTSMFRAANFMSDVLPIAGSTSASVSGPAPVFRMPATRSSLSAPKFSLSRAGPPLLAVGTTSAVPLREVNLQSRLTRLPHRRARRVQVTVRPPRGGHDPVRLVPRPSPPQVPDPLAGQMGRAPPVAFAPVRSGPSGPGRRPGTRRRGQPDLTGCRRLLVHDHGPWRGRHLGIACRELALDTRVLAHRAAVMRVVRPPAHAVTIGKPGFRSAAIHAVEPHRDVRRPLERAERLPGSRAARLPAHHPRVRTAPIVVADGTPLPVMVDLQSSSTQGAIVR